MKLRLHIFHSFKLKLAGAVSLVILIIVTSLAFYLIDKFEFERLIALEDKANTIAQIASTSVAPSLFFNDHQVLREDLLPVINNEEIKYIVLKDINEKIIFSYRHDEKGEGIFGTPDSSVFDAEGGVMHASQDIRMEGKLLGELHIGFSVQKIEKELNNIRYNVIKITILIIILGIISLLIVGNVLTRPLNSILHAAEEVKNGNFDVRAEVKSKDEIGFLASRFNIMIVTLKSFYNDLEGMVHKRTQELEELNEKMKYEIEERKIAEEKLKASLNDKIVLLKEIHHRVKNNLQVVSSLFYLQSRKVEDNKIKELFTESQNRILSMSMVHENLYKNETLSQVDFSEYVSKLISNLKNSYEVKENKCKILTEIEKIFLPVDVSIPLGLILNELITNSFKHAFNGYNVESCQENILAIKIIKTDKLKIEISDNGRGFPIGFEINKSQSLGMRLVKSLAAQVNASLTIKHDNGARIQMEL